MHKALPGSGLAQETVDFTGCSVLITGGTGSFGQLCTRTILRKFNDVRLIVLSRDELKQFEMAQDLRADAARVRFFIGDVRDGDRLEMAMRDVDYVDPRRRAEAGADRRIQSVRMHPRPT